MQRYALLTNLTTYVLLSWSFHLPSPIESAEYITKWSVKDRIISRPTKSSNT